MKFMLNKNIVVYTCITGDYDNLLPPKQVEPQIRYVCFINQPTLSVPGWEIRSIPREWGDSAQANRFAKMHPHLLFPEYELSIYIDGSIEIIGGLHVLAQSALKITDIAMYQHPFRDCVYEEAQVCANFGFDWYWRIESQMNGYRLNLFPKNAGLFECCVIIRRHSSFAIKTLMDAWWSAYQNGIKRDQLSLPYLAWKQNVAIQNLGNSDPRFSRVYFSLHSHRRPVPLSIRLRSYIHRNLFTLVNKWNSFTDYK
jgi:hypothetical protein